MTDLPKHPFEMRPLSQEEGGGWLITFPDLPGCLADGATPEEAIEHGKDAVAAWLDAVQAAGREVQQPGDACSGGFVIRSWWMGQRRIFRLDRDGFAVYRIKWGHQSLAFEELEPAG
jgi:predicted RNase H-like HicB family nuclease